MSGFYIGVDGKARKVKGGYIGVDGKARKIKKGYIGDANGVARLCWSGVDPVFANNTWEEIAMACQAGAVPDTWAVGDQKTMTIDGTDYVIDIIGKDHDDYSDGSGKAPLTFQLHDCYNTQARMHSSATTSIGWSGCEMRKTTLPAIHAKLPTAIKTLVKKVNKYTNKSGTLETTQDSLFLLSEMEIYGEITYSKEGEGTQYAYYAAGNSPKKKFEGTVDEYWTRSIYTSTGFLIVYPINGLTASARADKEDGIAFAFCF